MNKQIPSGGEIIKMYITAFLAYQLLIFVTHSLILSLDFMRKNDSSPSPIVIEDLVRYMLGNGAQAPRFIPSAVEYVPVFLSLAVALLIALSAIARKDLSGLEARYMNNLRYLTGFISFISFSIVMISFFMEAFDSGFGAKYLTPSGIDSKFSDFSLLFISSIVFFFGFYSLPPSPMESKEELGKLNRKIQSLSTYDFWTYSEEGLESLRVGEFSAGQYEKIFELKYILRKYYLPSFLPTFMILVSIFVEMYRRGEFSFAVTLWFSLLFVIPFLVQINLKQYIVDGRSLAVRKFESGLLWLSIIILSASYVALFGIVLYWDFSLCNVVGLIMVILSFTVPVVIVLMIGRRLSSDIRNLSRFRSYYRVKIRIKELNDIISDE